MASNGINPWNKVAFLLKDLISWNKFLMGMPNEADGSIARDVARTMCDITTQIQLILRELQKEQFWQRLGRCEEQLREKHDNDSSKD